MSEGRLLNRVQECRGVGFSRQEGTMETQGQEQTENRISKYFEGNTVSVLLDGIQRQERMPVEPPVRPARRSFGLPIREAQPTPRIQSVTPRRAVKLLKEQGVVAKVFCIHSSRQQDFIVNSREWNWHVLPLKKSGTKVPSEILARVALLLEQGAKIEKLYIAKPIDNGLGKVLIKEVVVQAKALGQEMSRLRDGMLDALQELQQGRSPVPALMRYMPDPVLLVKLRGYVELVEVGRWL